MGLIGVISLSAQQSMGEVTDKRPNIVFILTDDQRGSTVHDKEREVIETPHIDRLRESGTSFSQCYLFGANNGAVCKPSRAQLMTGRTYFQLPEVVTAGWAPLPEGHDNPLQYPTFPELLKKSGYRTFATGKQHNGKAWVEQGFSEADALFMGGMGSHFNLALQKHSKLSGWESYRSKGVYSSKVFTDAALGFLAKQDGSEPFMMYIAYTAPHDPRTAPKEYHEKYPQEAVALPENFQPEHPFPIASMRIRDEKLAPFPRTEAIVKKQLGDYYAMITATDHHIGRLLTALDKSGLRDNTIVILSSDNGLAVGQHGLMGKQNVYEHSIRLPLLLSGPGVPLGESSEAMVYLHDLAPTILEFAGVMIPEGMHAKSFVSQVKDPKLAGRPVIYSAYDSWRYERGNIKVNGTNRRFAKRGHGRSLRKGDYKLLIYHIDGQNTVRLFNLIKDPLEQDDLSQSPEMKGKIDEMHGLLKGEMRKAGDLAELDVPGWAYPEDRSR